MSRTLSTEEILHRMRAHVEANSGSQKPRASGNGVSPFQTSAPVTDCSQPQSRDFFPLRFEVDTALEGSRQFGQLNPRRPGLHNDAIQFLKRVMRRSLAWYTRPLHYFMGGVIRSLQQTLVLFQEQEGALQALRDDVTRLTSTVEQQREGLKLNGETLELHKQLMTRCREDLAQHHNKLAMVGEESARLRREIESLRDATGRYEKSLAAANEPCSLRFREISDELGWMRGELARSQNELRETKLEGRLRDRDWRRLFADIQAGTVAVPPQSAEAVAKAKAVESDTPADFDYFRFEEVYRGDEALIAQRQRAYLEFFRDRDNVVDIGCGRGEFLELLRANGIRARGVELGTDQFLLCKEKGLDVVQQDLFDFLESVPDGSLGGLFSAQVLEQLSTTDQLRFVGLAYKKTSPDSPVIFEALNIQSLFSLSRNFFLDPTHVRPVHPEMLKFAMESAKFLNVELRYSGACIERRIPPLRVPLDSGNLATFNSAIETLNDLVYGHLDYAAIGWH